MNALWIADAHLSDPRSDNYKSLQSLLSRNAEQLDSLVILGDLFDMWIGDNRILLARHEPLLRILVGLRKLGKRVYYVKGNHDFLLGRYFRDEVQADIIEDEVILEWDGYRFLVSHGDRIDDRDYGYRVLRRILRNPWADKLIRFIDDEKALRIGTRLAATAKATPNDKNLQRLEKTRLAYAVGHMQKNIHAVILAHTHRKRWEVIAVGKEQRLYVNPGSWLEERTFLWYSKGAFQLQQLTGSKARILFDFTFSVN